MRPKTAADAGELMEDHMAASLWEAAGLPAARSPPAMPGPRRRTRMPGGSPRERKNHVLPVLVSQLLLGREKCRQSRPMSEKAKEEEKKAEGLEIKIAPN